MVTEQEYERLHALAFRDGYPGYKPSVVEIPNGEGKADADKRYSHIALKYLDLEKFEDRKALNYLERAHAVATEIADALIADGVLAASARPVLEFSALRVLDYPPGAISNKHEDFSLFTLMCYRDQPDKFVSSDLCACPHDGECAPEALAASDALRVIRWRHNPQAHLGQLGTEFGLGAASAHQVLASETRQKSIVYFAIPHHATVLKDGRTVKEWLNERMARSRSTFTPY